MLLEIDHGIGFTTRRAVTGAEVELVMRVADLPGRLLLALPISREQQRPVNGVSRERHLAVPSNGSSKHRRCDASKVSTRTGSSVERWTARSGRAAWAWGVAVATQGSIGSTLSGVPTPLYIDLRGGLNT